MRKNNILDWIITLIVAIVAITTKSVELTLFIIFLYVIISLVYKYFASLKLSKIEDIDEHIEKYNKLLASEDDNYQKAFYLNNLSQCYFQKEEYEKALIFVREARNIIDKKEKKVLHLKIGRLNIVDTIDIINLNESRYLIYMGLLEESSRIMMNIDENRLGNGVGLFCLYLNRAELAIEAGFPHIARTHLMKLDEIIKSSKSQINNVLMKSSFIFTQIKCDILEKDFVSASNKLDSLIESDLPKHIIEKATKLKTKLTIEKDTEE